MTPTLKDIGLRCAQEQTNINGSLEYEGPINLTNGNEFQGDCAIGAFTYINSHGYFFGTRIGRYCSLANWIVAGPGAHDTSRFAMHPFVFDPEGAISGLGDFPEYQKVLGRTPISSTLAPAMTASTAIEIGHDVWIGTRAIIMKGVKIGHGAVVAAGAIVTRDVPPYTIVAGVPAKPIRLRFEKPIVDALLELQWWNYDMSAVSNKVDYGKPKEVIDYMQRALKKGELKRFRPDIIRIERAGTAFNISRKPPA